MPPVVTDLRTDEVLPQLLVRRDVHYYGDSSDDSDEDESADETFEDSSDESYEEYIENIVKALKAIENYNKNL